MTAAAARAGRVRAAAVFAGSYLVRFLQANVEVTREILSRGDGLDPAVVEVELRSRTRFEVASFVGFVGLTPGTVALALSEDSTRLLVHGMHSGGPERLREDLRRLEDQMLAVWRPAPSRRTS